MDEAPLRALQARLREADERADAAEQRAREAEERKRDAERQASDAERRARDADARASAAEKRLDGVTATEARAEPKRGTASGGKRLAELERLLEEAVQRAERFRGRAEDAERRASELESFRIAPARPQREPTRGRGGVAEVWWSPGDECFEAIALEIERARETIDVCVFTITDDRLANALVDAHRRGVRLRIITDNDKSLDEGSDVRRLSRGGIPVRVDRTEFHMHHKFAVFDGERAVTGSYNWTRGAARNNEEHVVVTDDARLVDALLRGFERLWRKFED